jgi:hypothetical protein
MFARNCALVAWFTVALGACAAQSPRSPQPTTPAHPPSERATLLTTSESRRLDAHRDFGDLVRLARALLSAGHGDSQDVCLLTAAANGYALSGDLMPALTELPDAPADLDARLKRGASSIGVLSAWGAMPSERLPAEPALILAGFTAVPVTSLRASLAAIILTDEGAYVRTGAQQYAEQDGPLAPDAAVQRWIQQPHAPSTTLYVSAEYAVPMSALVALLRKLPAETGVALAIVLPEGTRLPPSPTPQQSPPALCPDGLPEPAAALPEGALDTSVLIDALAPLREQAARCLDGVHGAARAGGRLTLALRIAADGTVQDTCLLTDAIGDAALAGCVLDSARLLHLPVPNPAGFVDVHLPLLLEPTSAPTLRSICD